MKVAECVANKRADFVSASLYIYADPSSHPNLFVLTDNHLVEASHLKGLIY